MKNEIDKDNRANASTNIRSKPEKIVDTAVATPAADKPQAEVEKSMSTQVKKRPPTYDDEVEDSFPASDPPSATSPITGGGSYSDARRDRSE